MFSLQQLFYRQQELITCLKNSQNHLQQIQNRNLERYSFACAEANVRMKTIEANWTEFKKNHRLIVALRGDENENEPYFISQTYIKTEEIYHSAMTGVHRVVHDYDRLFRQQELIRSLNSTAKWLTDKGEGNLTRGEIIVRMHSIETNWKDFKDNHKELVLLRDESNRWEPYFSLDCYVNQEAKYMKIMSFIVDALDKLPKVSTDEKISQTKADLPPKYTGVWPLHSTTLTSRLQK